MATFKNDVPYEDLFDIQQELILHPLAVNPDRRKSGKGRSQAFGVIRRWSYRPWISRNTWMRVGLWGLLQKFAEKYVTVDWDAVQVNDTYESQPHRDKGNRGESYIISFGEYDGGELVIQNGDEEHVVDTKYRGHTFNGSQLLHWNKPIIGRKFSLVFFKIENPKFWPEEKGKPLSTVVSYDGKGYLEIKDVDGAIYRANKKEFLTIVEPTMNVGYVGKVLTSGGKSRI